MELQKTSSRGRWLESWRHTPHTSSTHTLQHNPLSPWWLLPAGSHLKHFVVTVLHICRWSALPELVRGRTCPSC